MLVPVCRRRQPSSPSPPPLPTRRWLPLAVMGPLPRQGLHYRVFHGWGRGAGPKGGARAATRHRVHVHLLDPPQLMPPPRSVIHRAANGRRRRWWWVRSNPASPMDYNAASGSSASTTSGEDDTFHKADPEAGKHKDIYCCMTSQQASESMNREDIKLGTM